MLRKRCAGPLLLVLLTVTGCQLTQSAFSRTVGNAGAVFSAASTTLSYAHEGKITSAYAQASFVNYQSELDGLDQQLPSQAHHRTHPGAASAVSTSADPARVARLLLAEPGRIDGLTRWRLTRTVRDRLALLPDADLGAGYCNSNRWLPRCRDHCYLG